MAAPIANARLLLTTLKTSLSLRCRLIHCHKVGRICPGHTSSYRLFQAPRHLCSKPTGESGEDAASPGDQSEIQEQKPRLSVELAKPKGSKKLAAAAKENEAESSSSDSESSSDSSDSSDDETDMKPEMVSAAKNVAKALGGDVRQTESDLLSQLFKHEQLTQAQKGGQLPPQPGQSIIEVVSGMKVKQDSPKQSVSSQKPGNMGKGFKGRERLPSSEVHEMKAQPRRPAQHRRSGQTADVKLYAGSALGIFSKKSVTEHREVVCDERPNLFSVIEQAEVEKSCRFPAPNAFEEMIQWTQQGKIWRFPIDNEYGLEEEATVGFHEHVFLDHLLAHFPEKGPVRIFIELVIVGLSKNPYLTVQQKHEHVMWFKDYFEQKQHILEELMATGEDKAQKELQ